MRNRGLDHAAEGHRDDGGARAGHNEVNLCSKKKLDEEQQQEGKCDVCEGLEGVLGHWTTNDN